MTILGNYTMQPTATYLAEISSTGASDLIAVGGTAQLNGTLNVVSANPRQTLANQTLTILTSGGGVTGQFANLISTNRIKYTVNYLSHAVQVVIGALQNFRDAFVLRWTRIKAMQQEWLVILIALQTMQPQEVIWLMLSMC